MVLDSAPISSQPKYKQEIAEMCDRLLNLIVLNSPLSPSSEPLPTNTTTIYQLFTMDDQSEWYFNDEVADNHFDDNNIEIHLLQMTCIIQ